MRKREGCGLDEIADLVYYALPTVLVWLPANVNVYPWDNVGLSLTLFAANFYEFLTQVRTVRAVENVGRTSARLRPSKTSSCC